jgi:hypothetical protein
MVLLAALIKAPLYFLAVGSQAMSAEQFLRRSSLRLSIRHWLRLACC